MLALRYYVARVHDHALGLVGLVLALLSTAALLKDVIQGAPPAGLFIGFAVAGLAMFVPGLVSTLKTVRLVRSGEAIAARIEKLDAFHDFSRGAAKKSTQTMVVYTWASASGERQRSSTTLDGGPHKWKHLEADPVVVLDPKRPAEPQLDLFGTRAGQAAGTAAAHGA